MLRSERDGNAGEAKNKKRETGEKTADATAGKKMEMIPLTRKPGKKVTYEVYLSTSRLIVSFDEKEVSVVREMEESSESNSETGMLKLYAVIVTHAQEGVILNIKRLSFGRNRLKYKLGSTVLSKNIVVGFHRLFKLDDY